MQICVHGLWHLGALTAACLASGGHSVRGLDESEDVVRDLNRGTPPLFEPGLAELTAQGLASGRLQFTTDAAAAAAGADVYWVTYDTPVDENDVADVEFVVDRVKRMLRFLPRGCLVVVSSQLPVGSVRRLADYATSIGLSDALTFACSPENLRLGKAIEVFTQPDRVVVGLGDKKDERKVGALFAPFTQALLFMSIESAEMTKHALNSFFAMSVAFANEIGTLCEKVSADAGEVARGLKSEARIGPKAYVAPGMPFAGGTLARDIAFLSQLSQEHQLGLTLLPSVRESNDRHRGWALRRLNELLHGVSGKTVAVLGLTYKPGTSTLRRSSSIELARALSEAGAIVRGYDPDVSARPPEMKLPLVLVRSIQEALTGASAAVVATALPEFRSQDWNSIVRSMGSPIILDPAGMLAEELSNNDAVTYATVGRALRAGGVA
jgi:UDPglucose 6-dehydrogenase